MNDRGVLLSLSSEVDLANLVVGALDISLLAGCLAQPNDKSSAAVLVRVYVDCDTSSAWNSGDFPLSDVSVSLDGKSAVVTDQDGLARSEAVSATQHTLALNEQDIVELETQALICESGSQTPQVEDDSAVHFCFTTQGFLKVDIKDEEQGG